MIHFREKTSLPKAPIGSNDIIFVYPRLVECVVEFRRKLKIGEITN